MKSKAALVAGLVCDTLLMTACSPSVRLEAPEKPIEINMNVKIEHEIRLKVEKDVDALISSEKGLF